jgi:restriction endonuclease S subunit
MYTTNYFYRYVEDLSTRFDQHFLNPIWDIKIDRMNKSNFVPLHVYLSNNIQSGITPKKEQMYTSDIAPSDSINFIQIGSIDWKGNIKSETDYKIDSQFLESLDESSIVRKNDLLLAATGATIGKVGIYKSDEPSIACGDLLTIRIKDERLAEIIHFFMLTDYGKEQIIRNIFGSTNGHIKSADVENILVPEIDDNLIELFNKEIVPQINYYYAIKEKERKLLIEIDATILRELHWKANFNTFPVSEYTHSFFRYPSEINSRLDTLYNDIIFDSLYKNIESSPYDFFELSKFVDLRLEFRNPQNEPEQYFDYVDIGSIDTTYGSVYPTRMQGNEATSSRVRQVMYANDILVSTTRPTRRAIAIVPNYLDNQICSTGFAVLIPKKEVIGEFLFHILRSEIVTAQFERFCSGSGYPAINKENDVLRVLVPEVNKDEQDNILSKITTKLQLAKSMGDEAEKYGIKVCIGLKI